MCAKLKDEGGAAETAPPSGWSRWLRDTTRRLRRLRNTIACRRTAARRWVGSLSATLDRNAPPASAGGVILI